jgi:molybdenum cofactor guanylyltransferase
VSNLGERPPLAPIGVILAGGAGRRIGGSKAMVCLHGKPLIYYPLEAIGQVLEDVVVLAKPSTELPSLAGITVWLEPEEPSHPLLGIMHALSLAENRAVLICATDLPLVTAAAIEQLVGADPLGAPAVIARAGTETQPLLGCYRQEALERLSQSGLSGEEPVREAIEAIGVRTLEVDPRILFNVNYPDDLLQAAAMVDPPELSPDERWLEPGF